MGLPLAPGVGFKPQHFAALMRDPGPVAWLEVHAENYMGDGGRLQAQLRHLADRFPISVHGVGLSIGGEALLDPDHLARLKRLCDALNPASFSEHLAWSSHDGAYFNDLLPLAYTATTLERVASHIDQVQTVLGRQMLLENPSSYYRLPESDLSEAEFLVELTRRTGCLLLLDLNNVFVSSRNLGFLADDFVAAIPPDLVGEIHLGGHLDDAGTLIDSHNAPVADEVWALFAAALVHCGPRPTLIEWDNDIPDWPILAAETARVALAMQ